MRERVEGIQNRLLSPPKKANTRSTHSVTLMRMLKVEHVCTSIRLHPGCSLNWCEPATEQPLHYLSGDELLMHDVLL